MTDERRKHPRIKEVVKVVCKEFGIEGEYDLYVLDVSGGGLRLPLKQKLNRGTLLELSINMPQDKEPFFALGRVVWQSPEPINKGEDKLYYETGVEFLKVDLQDKMHIIRYIYNRLKEKKKKI